MSKSFEALSQEVALQFLQNVVVVDDRAYLRESDRIEAHPGLNVPGLNPKISPLGPDASTEGDSTHDLNAKLLIDLFADKGLICSVLTPRYKEDFEEKVIRSSERADIVILDWQLQGKMSPEVNATGVISKILAGEKSHDRIRLIAIYSAEKPLEISDKIEEALKNSGSFSKQDDYTFVQDAARICVFAKEDTKGADATRIVKEIDIPTRLIDEFTKMTMGLLSNAALGSMAAIRKNAHRIIGKFPPSLDAPYLSHRALMTPSEEAESHIVPLIVSEIQSVLEDKRITEYLSQDYIDSWISSHANILSLCKRMGIATVDDAKKALHDLIINGICKETTSASHPDWGLFLKLLKDDENSATLSKLTDILTQDGNSGNISDRRLAYLMSVCSHYENTTPILSLGSIIQDAGDNGRYYLCVQPLCDSVRLEGKRMFPFLRMIEADSSGAKDFGFIVPEAGGNLIALRLNLRPHQSKMFGFRPKTGEGVITAYREGDNWIFNGYADDKEAIKLIWVADLKPAHAQRVANDYAREISRVGLTESEWLRRQTSKMNR